MLLLWLFRQVTPGQFFSTIFSPGEGLSSASLLQALPLVALLLAAAAGGSSAMLGATAGEKAQRQGIPLLLLALAALMCLLSPAIIGWSFLLNALLATLGVLIVVAASSLGLRLLQIMQLSTERFDCKLEALVVATALGLGALGLTVFILGSAGVLTGWFWWPFLLLVLLSGFTPLRNAAAGLWPATQTYAARNGHIALGVLVFLAIYLATHLPLIWSPPLEYDVLEYHLAAPAQYLREGYIHFLPENIYASFPQNGEMLYLLSLILAGDKLAGLPAAHTIVFSAWLLSIAGVYTLTRRLARANPGTSAISPAAALAATFYALIPMGSEWMADFYVEHLQALFHLSALIAACIFLFERQSGIRNRTAWLILCGVLAGLCCGTKYTGLLFTLAALAGILAIFCLGSMYEALQVAGLVMTSALAVLSPWLLRNLIAAGDPLFPLGLLMRQRFSNPGLTDPGWLDYFDVAHRSSRAPGAILASFVELFPGFRATQSWLRDIELGPHLLCFALPGLSAIRSRAAAFVAAVFVADLLLWALFTHRINRFVFPLLGPLAVLCGLGVARLWTVRALRKAVLAVTALLVAVTGPLTMVVVWAYSRPDAITGIETREDAPRLQHHSQSQSIGERFDIWQEINALPPQSKVLCVGDAQTFYLRQTPAYAVVFNRSLLEDALTQADDAQSAALYLAAQGITHLYLNYPEWHRLDWSYAIARGEDGHWRRAGLDAEQRQVLSYLLRTRRFASYSAAWPAEVHRGYLRVGTREYALLDELYAQHTKPIWTSDDSELPLYELRRLSGP